MENCQLERDDRQKKSETDKRNKGIGFGLLGSILVAASPVKINKISVKTHHFELFVLSFSNTELLPITRHEYILQHMLSLCNLGKVAQHHVWKHLPVQENAFCVHK